MCIQYGDLKIEMTEFVELLCWLFQVYGILFSVEKLGMCSLIVKVWYWSYLMKILWFVINNYTFEFNWFCHVQCIWK